MLVFYLRIWIRLTSSAFQIAFVSRFGALLFTTAKLLRFIFFLLIVVLIVSHTKTLAGYTLNQSLVFFLTYNVIDTLTQSLFRDVYRFRQHIISGYFDYILLKPMDPLFKILFGGADPMDLIVLLPYLGLLVYFITQIFWSMVSLTSFLILIINAFMISTAFHICVLALGIITTEVDHTIMIYRDIASMARFPVDIYREPLRAIITFVIPIGIMMTFPPKALFGLLSPVYIVVSLVVGIVFIYLSLKFWRFALTQYTSASS